MNPREKQMPIMTTVDGDFRVNRVENLIMTREELWNNQAPNCNFGLGPDELLERALEKGFVKCIGPNQYVVNVEYNRGC